MKQKILLREWQNRCFPIHNDNHEAPTNLIAGALVCTNKTK